MTEMTPEIHVTALEMAILRNIAENNYQDGCTPEDRNDIWLSAIFDGNGPLDLDPKQGRGALTSCQNKGLVQVFGKGRDAGVALTEVGVAVYYMERPR